MKPKIKKEKNEIQEIVYQKKYRKNPFKKKKEISKNIMSDLNTIKSQCFQIRFVSLPFNYYGWWLSPFAILGIG